MPILAKVRGNSYETILGGMDTRPGGSYFQNCRVYLLKLVYTKNMNLRGNQGPVVQSVVSLTSSLRIIALTVLADSLYNIPVFFAEKMWVACKSYSHFFSKKFQHICVSLDVNFNESLTNDIVSFEQLGPDLCCYSVIKAESSSVDS